MRLPRTRHRSSLHIALLALAVAGLALVGCRQVASGNLHVANDLSGIGQDNTFLRAYAPDPGDAWPPTGQVNLFVRGDDFGSPPSYGMNGYLYLVRTSAACPQSEGAPEVFTLGAVTITGVVTVTAGSVNQFVTMADTPANRAPTWALIEVTAFPNTGGGHLIRRCGTITWTP